MASLATWSGAVSLLTAALLHAAGCSKSTPGTGNAAEGGADEDGIDAAASDAPAESGSDASRSPRTGRPTALPCSGAPRPPGAPDGGEDGGSCRTDSDCDAGDEVATPNDRFTEATGYFCTSPQDECLGCVGPCIFELGRNHFACGFE